MKKFFLIFIIFILAGASSKAQENEQIRVITGIRVNPFILFDFKGNKKEVMRLHAEVGGLLKKRTYISLGYTPFVNSIYNFNEYWFIGLQRKVPVSIVVAFEYMINEDKFIFQSGPNVKLSKIGNVFAFFYTPIDKMDWGLKVGVFIPLNVIVYKK